MLQKLLTEIQSGGSFEVKNIASRLNTTPEMVVAMLQHLQRSGQLKNFPICEDACNGCALKSACLNSGTKNSVTLWQG